MSKDRREIQRKMRTLQRAEETGHVAKACHYFGIGRTSFYRWKAAFPKDGEEGLINRPAIPKCMPINHRMRSRRKFFIFGANTISTRCSLFYIWNVITASNYRMRRSHAYPSAMVSFAFRGACA